MSGETYGRDDEGALDDHHGDGEGAEGRCSASAAGRQCRNASHALAELAKKEWSSLPLTQWWLTRSLPARHQRSASAPVEDASNRGQHESGNCSGRCACRRAHGVLAQSPGKEAPQQRKSVCNMSHTEKANDMERRKSHLSPLVTPGSRPYSAMLLSMAPRRAVGAGVRLTPAKPAAETANATCAAAERKSSAEKSTRGQNASRMEP